MNSIFGSVLADDGNDRRARPGSLPVDKPRTTAAISSSSALTAAVSALPATDRTSAEFALTALDLFNDRELTEMIATIRRHRSRNRAVQPTTPQPPRLDRSITETVEASALPAFAGYNFAHKDFPGDLISMVWSPGPQLPVDRLPEVVYSATDAAPIIGTTASWIGNRLSAARRQGETSVLLVSRDGTRAARRRLDSAEVKWTVLILKEALRP